MPESSRNPKLKSDELQQKKDEELHQLQEKHATKLRNVNDELRFLNSKQHKHARVSKMQGRISQV